MHCAGRFPVTADDHVSKRIDVLEHLVKHPQATFQMRVSGDSMRDAHIFDADMLIMTVRLLLVMGMW